MQARELLDKVLALNSSDSIYLHTDSSQSYITELTITESTSLFAFQFSDQFSIKFPEFNLWLTQTYAIHNNELLDFVFPPQIEIILLKLDELSTIIIRENNTILLQLNGRKCDNFTINTISYGLILSSQAYEKIIASEFDFLVDKPAEVSIALLNALYSLNELSMANSLFTRLDVDTIQQHLLYLRPQVCGNFGIYFLASGIVNGFKFMDDFEEILLETSFYGGSEDFYKMQQVLEVCPEVIRGLVAVNSDEFQLKIFQLFPTSQEVQNTFLDSISALISTSNFKKLSEISFLKIQSITAETAISQPEKLSIIAKNYFSGPFDQYKQFALLGFVLVALSFCPSFSDEFLSIFTEKLTVPPPAFYEAFAVFLQLKISIPHFTFFLFKHKKTVKILQEFTERVPIFHSTEKFFAPFLQDSGSGKLNSSAKIIEGGNQCPVCLCGISDVVVLGCSHELCSECFSQVSECPICRGDVERFTFQGILYE